MLGLTAIFFMKCSNVFFKEVGIKQRNKQTEELLKPVIFTAQFATLILHLKVTGIPVCVCDSPRFYTASCN